MILEQDDLIKALEVINAQVCGYTHGKKLAKFCDCKFGIGEIVNEKSGCPEMRQTVGIFKEMTVHEYETIIKRIKRRIKKYASKNFMTRVLESPDR